MILDVFAKIQACKTDEELAEIRGQIDDFFLTKLFWELRLVALSNNDMFERQKAVVICKYINHIFCSSVPVSMEVNQFFAPHGFKGIAISKHATVGKGCTIFQNATIGSNTLPDSKNAGFPTVGNNVYIGANANVIGNVTIGDNVRIGAGCTVTTDVPANATIVPSRPTIIRKDAAPDNRFVFADDFLKLRQNHTPPPLRASSRMKMGGCSLRRRKRRANRRSKFCFAAI